MARYHRAMEPLQIPHNLSAPVYGIVAHAHIHLNLPGSEYAILQALAILEAVAPCDEWPGPFYATIEDFAHITNLTPQTIIKTLKKLEMHGVITRKTASFTPTRFEVNWSRTALTFEESIDLGGAQQAIREEFDLPM